MIVFGADMYNSSHTVAAVAAATGEVLDDKTRGGRRSRL
jgi:hypothetical protein